MMYIGLLYLVLLFPTALILAKIRPRFCCFAYSGAVLGLLGLGLGGNGTIFMKVVLADLPPGQAGSGTGTYGLFRDISAPFGVAVFVPMFTNLITALMEDGVSREAAAVYAVRRLSVVELVCVAASVLVVRMLPKTQKK